MPGTVAELRQEQSRLTTELSQDLSNLWSRLSSFSNARRALPSILDDLVNTYGPASATIGSEWYSDARDLAQIAGLFRPTPARIQDNAIGSLVDWGVSSGFNLSSIKVLIIGGATRRVLDWGRQSVMSNALADRKAQGWQRVGSGECDFCELLIGRGAVYTERTADFSTHDHCQCQAVPAFHGRPKPVKPFTPSPRQNPDDRARARSYIAEHQPQ